MTLRDDRLIAAKPVTEKTKTKKLSDDRLVAVVVPVTTFSDDRLFTKVPVTSINSTMTG